MELTSTIYQLVRDRIIEKCYDDFEDRIYIWDGSIQDLVAGIGLKPNKLSVVLSVIQQAPVVLQGAASPMLINVTFRLAVFLSGMKASTINDDHLSVYDAVDRVSRIFLFNTGGQDNWVLAGTPISNVSRGAVTPISQSADYIARGFDLNLKAPYQP